MISSRIMTTSGETRQYTFQESSSAFIKLSACTPGSWGNHSAAQSKSSLSGFTFQLLSRNKVFNLTSACFSKTYIYFKSRISNKMMHDGIHDKTNGLVNLITFA